MSEGSTTGQKQCEQILLKLAEPKIQHSGHKGSSDPAIDWALLRLNHCSLFLVRDDIVALKLSR